MYLNYNRGRGSWRECRRCKGVHRHEVTSQGYEGQTEGQGQTSRDDSEVSGLSEAGITEGQALRKKMRHSGENALSLRSQWALERDA